MKVCLIYPPRIPEKQWNYEKRVHIPLSLAYLASFLERDGHNVKIIDSVAEGVNKIHEIKIGEEKRKLIGLNPKEIKNKVEKFNPDLIGVSFPFTSFSPSSYIVVNELSKLKKPIVIGGAHATVMTKECLENKNINFVIMGEGEETLLEIVKLLEKNKNPSIKELAKIKGLAFKKNGKVKINMKRPFITDLDYLPLPAWNLLPMKIYQNLAEKGQTSRKAGKRFMTVLSSRGCPFQCTFCSGREIMGLGWRGRKPEKVVEEIEILIKRYGVKLIEFEDDNLTLDKKRINEICDLIIKKKLKIELRTPNGVRADTLDYNLLKKMKKAGLREISIAPESGDQNIVTNIIKKNLDLKKIEEIVRDCKKLGVVVYCFFIIGMIGETPETMRKTMGFAFKLGKLGAKVYGDVMPMLPLYKTPQYELAVKKNYLKKIPGKKYEMSILDMDSLIETDKFTKKDIEDIRAEWRKRARIFSITQWDGIKHHMKHFFEIARTRPGFLVKGTLREINEYSKIIFK